MANFDFYLCLRINFHTSSFWVLILAAGGPYWVLISPKNGSLLGPYLKAWGSSLVLEAVALVGKDCCVGFHNDGALKNTLEGDVFTAFRELAGKALLFWSPP